MRRQKADSRKQRPVTRETTNCLSSSDVLPSAFCLLPLRRAGISLMEVLISIGIMAIGLVSAASLLPMGGLQAEKANIEERKTELALNALRDFHVRGMAAMTDAGTGFPWVTAAPNAPQPYFNFLPPQSPARPNGMYLPTTGYPPVAIDPMMSSVSIADGRALNNVRYFPINKVASATPPVSMPRLTLTSLYHNNPVVARALAEAVFVDHNHTFSPPPEDRSLPGTGAVIFDNATGRPLMLDYEGLYSWLATITPNYPFSQTTAVGPDALYNFRLLLGNEYTLSIVVFYRRVVPRPGSGNFDPNLIGEELVGVRQPAAGTTVNIGGGDMTIAAPTEAQSQLVRPGTWLMLGRNDTVMGIPRAIFKWYRVLSAAGTPDGDLQVTLSGPDWNWGNNSFPTYAALFDGAVAVLQRTIHLEGPSTWSQ